MRRKAFTGLVIVIFELSLLLPQLSSAIPAMPSSASTSIQLICPPTSLPGGEGSGGLIRIGTCEANPEGDTFLLFVGSISPYNVSMASVTDDHNPNSAWIGPVSCATSTDRNGGNNYFYYLESSVAAEHGVIIKVTPTAGDTFNSALLVEAKGLDSKSLIDQCATNSDQKANIVISSPTVTTKYPSELLVAWGSCENLSSSMYVGFTAWTFLHAHYGMTGVGGCQAGLRIVNTTGSYKAEFEQSDVGTYANSFVTFKAAVQPVK
jgi:hypothetical protein